MAITASLLTSGNDTTAGTTTVTASVSPTANKLLLMFIGSSAQNNGDNAAPSSVVGAGLAFTKVAEYVSEVGWENQTVWCAYDASVSTGTITVTFPTTQSQIHHTLVEFTGVDGSTGDNGLAAVIQKQGVTNGGDNPTATSTASLAAFGNAGNATVMYWNAATADAVPVTTTGSAGFTEMLDYHVNTGLGWDVHVSLYFKASADQTGVVTASAFGSFNAKILIALELKALGSVTNYTLAAGVGAYSYAGNAATLSWGRKMAAAVGAYTYAGNAATLSYGRKMAAAVGAYAYAGAAAGLVYARNMAAGVGAYAYAGIDAGLSYGRKLAADVGAYVYTGNDADLIWTVAPAGNEPGFQEDAFQSDAYQVAWDEVVLSLWEGADIASFSTTATTFIGFDVVEGPDLAAFNTTAKTFVNFALTEGADVFAFDVDVKTHVTFEVTEGPDVFSFSVLTGAQLSFAVTEGPDVPQFRTFTTWWDRGDAYYMYVPYEIQSMTLTADTASYILVAAENRTVYIPDEWQRIDVDQERARRRETT